MTQRPLIVGITGGIGCGKSTVARYLCNQGYKVYDSDAEAKKIQNYDVNVRTAIMQLFGNQAYTENGMNRGFVAQCVFKDKNLLQKLNEIVHPIVKADFLEWINKNINEKIIFIESAILYESGFNSLVDKILLISANKETRIRRVMRRDGTTREQIIQRINNQTSMEDLKQRADIILYTDDDVPINVKIFILLRKLINDNFQNT